ncbi:beta-ketoacyl synthase N-terminal-like domain-containing protein, partial [Streptomyces anulatus]
MADNLSPESTEDLLSTLAGRRATTTIDAEDAAVRDHLVHDVPVLPGVFLLDLVLRLVGRAGVDPAAVQLRRVTFLAPVLGTAEGRRIDVEIGPGGTGRLPVTVRSRPAGSDGAWETNCRAEIHPAAREPRPGRVDHVVLEAAGTEVVDVEDLYALARRIEIRHRGFMKATGLVHVGRDHALARMRVAAEAEPYLERFHAHPAVLDFATLVPMLLLRQDRRADADHAFIPIYVDSFHATSGVGAENLVHVPGPVTGRLDGELFEADLEVCSLDGTVVARLGGFRAKRVRSADLITHRPPQTGKQRDGATTPSHAAADTPRPRAGGLRETVEALVAAKLGLDPDEIDPDRGFYDLGLNSLDLLGIADALEDGLSTELYPTLLFEYPTVRSLVDHLGGIGLGAPVQEETAPTAPVTAPPPARRPSAASPAGEEGHREPVAIVGMAGRYPGAATAEDLWEVLRDGVDQVTGVPRERWDDTAWTGAFCAGVADFDAPFFHLSAEQALTMDPHERLLLQTAWEALENAGQTPEGLAEQTGGAVGVFAGAMWNDYQLTGLDRWRGGGGEVVGSWSSALTNRISYAFDFEGPSVTVDTACSASLAALHIAVQSIRRGECRAALAGGVNLSLHPYKYLRLGELGLLSESGRCRPFDAEADGYVPGEGVGVVVLRPLADALASGDRVLGIVRGSALRHSGRTGGYTVPSPDAQAKVISAALTDADVTADTVGYVEAHASSTTLGDRIEVEALTSAYRQHGAVTPGACAIGSAKGTIGHLEAASGMAALAKVLLALRHRTIPAGPGIGRPNPGVSFDRTPFRLPAHEEPWAAPVDPATGAVGPRRAALSTFGAGGANVHLVVEEFTQAAPPPPAHGAGQPRTVPLSARTEEELRRQAHRLAVHLRAAAGPCLDDVAHTLRAGRRPMEHRLAVVVRDLDELAVSLQDFADGRAPGSPRHTGR